MDVAPAFNLFSQNLPFSDVWIWRIFYVTCVNYYYQFLVAAFLFNVAVFQ